MVHYTHTSRAISPYHNQTYACSMYGKSFKSKSLSKEIVLSLKKPIHWINFGFDQHVLRFARLSVNYYTSEAKISKSKIQAQFVPYDIEF